MVNSTVIIIESWFIPMDILMIITTTLGIIFGLSFLLVVITHKRCWSVPILLTCNSCVVEVLFSCMLLPMAIFALQQDLELNTGDLSLCMIPGFIVDVVFVAQNYGFLLTAMYRYISVVYPRRLSTTIS